MTKLILIRHGETQWNHEGRFQGMTDVPLSPVGIEQAQETAEEFRNEKIDFMCSSELSRAIRTAEIIANYHGIEFDKRKELNEISLGIWEGKTHEQLMSEYPKMWAERQKDKYNFRIPEGESYADVNSRVIPFINNLLKEHDGKTIMVVAHGGVIRIVIMHLLGVGPEKMSGIMPLPAKPNVFTINDGKINAEVLNY